MSDLLTNPAESTPISEHSLMLLGAHRAMRADARRLAIALDDLPDRPPEDALALGSAFAELVTLIHDHHWAEDDVIYPFLIERVHGFEHDAGRLEHDHIELDAAMARLSAGLRMLAHQRTPTLRYDTHRHLIDGAAAFAEILVSHLDREEDLVVPAFESVLSAADQRALSKQESKRATYRHVSMAVPWVLANATPGEAAALRAAAPRVLSILHGLAWKQRFARVMTPLYRPTLNQKTRT
jgi:hypothetical protein